MNTPRNNLNTNPIEALFKEISDEVRPRISKFLERHWGADQIVTKGQKHQADELPGYVAFYGGKIIGLITYHIEDDSCEIVSLNSEQVGFGIGTSLINRVKTDAKTKNCKRVWVITTNDNIAALRFYQKRGFSLIAVYPKAILESRKLKPTIPDFGLHGIPILDEIELEIQI